MVIKVERLIGKNIKRIRTIKGFTQSYVADQLGYKSSTIISEIESGKKGFDADRVPKLAAILDVKIEELFQNDIHEKRIHKNTA